MIRWSDQANVHHPTFERQIDWMRPGEGERGDGCGTWGAWRCFKEPNLHPMVPFTRQCRGRGCPEFHCWTGWSKDNAKKVVRRLQAGQHYYTVHHAPRHITLSHDAQVVPSTREELNILYRAAMDTMIAMGFLGGVIIFHPWRHKGKLCWYAGPHFHVFGFGAVDARLRPDGWFVKTIRKRQKSWQKTVAYILDHTGYDRHSDLKAYRWFAGFSYASVPRDILRRVTSWLVFQMGQDTTAREVEIKRCEVCEAPMMVYPSILDIAF